MTVVAEAPRDWAGQFAGAAREIYRRTLLELARRDPRIYCLDTDMGGLEEAFEATLPGQYVDLGIAEANMMTVAAALAASGKIPFVNTMASFASARACEQIKVDIAYNNVPVKIVATHAGLSAGHLGPTHHALEDVAIMRAFPNMTVIIPADAAETAKTIEAIVDVPGPVYVRLGRKATDPIYHADYEFTIGRAIELRPGRDVTIVAAGGHPVLAALAAHDRLASDGISARILNLHTLKPVDVRSLIDAATSTRGVVTVEEHSIIGGLGSAVAEVLGEHAPAPLRRIGIPDTFCDRVGGQADLLATYGITAERVTETARLLAERGRLSGRRSPRGRPTAAPV